MRKEPHNHWTKILRAYIRLAFAHPWLVIAIFAGLGTVCTWYAATRLEVVTDLGALLPEGTASVEALNESKQRIGSTDFFVIAIASESHDAQAIARTQDALKEKIEQQWTDAQWVHVARDTSFFRDHALYYFSEEKLLALKDIIEESVVASSAESMPGMVNLLDDGDDQTPDLATRIKDWMDPDTLRRLGMPPQVNQVIQRLFSEREDKAAPAAPNDSALDDRLIGPKGDVGVVLVQLDKPSTDLDYARFALSRGEALIATVPDLVGGGDLRAQVVGAYRSFREVDAVADDGRNATIVSVTLILLFVFIFFRSPRAVAAVFIPLWIAGAFTMAATAVLYGRLTALTVFVLAMLAGMGIDYGIHLFGHALTEMRSGQSAEKSTFIAIDHAGRAVAVAALTSIASLFALQVGHFQGFREFGTIAALGLVFCALAAVLVMPPLIASMERLRPYCESGTPKSRVQSSWWGRQSRLSVRRLAAHAFAAAILITFGLALFIPKVRFENDFRRLRGPKTEATIGYGRAIGKNASTTPSVILGHDRHQMRAAHEALLAQLESPTLLSFITLNTFVPDAGAQERRREIIEKIAKLVDTRAMSRHRGKSRQYINELRHMSRATPFDEHELPEWAARIITERDGKIGNIGHLYANVEDWNANSVRAFKQEWENFLIDGKPLVIANSAFILSDVVEMVRNDGARLLAAVFITLSIILAVFARSLRGAAILIAAVAMSVVWTVGLMGLLDVRIGLYNIIVIPVVLGVSIDTAIHLFHRHRALGTKGLMQNLRTTGMMVTASSWTTIFGFTGLLFVSHLGLRTIGVLACLGVAASWLAILLALPFLLTLLEPSKHPSSVGKEPQRCTISQ